MKPFRTVQLDNGLTILLREVHSAPVVSFWVVYQIGSRNEPTGLTGISHWVEHMMFKGTERYPQGLLDRLIDRAGGQWNAFTTTDYTMYYSTLPADRIELALDAEADRMMNAEFDPEEVESERTVIISERQGIENRPTFWLGEAMRAAAFRVHGYHHEIIGDMADLTRISRDDLYTHYQRHYVPSNATLIVVGAFETEAMIRQIEALYGHLPGGDAPPLFVRDEPEQQGERRVTVERPGHTAFVRVAYRVPQSTHEDWFRLEMLDSILTGPGGGLDNKTSRLYRELVKSGIAASISGGLQETIDPYLYTIAVTVNDGRSHAEAEQRVLDAVERIRNEGVTEAELAKARKQARAAFAYGTESITNQAYWLAQSAALGDPTWFDQYLQRLEAITVDDIQEVALRYLGPRGRTVGWLVPTGMDDDYDDEAWEDEE